MGASHSVRNGADYSCLQGHRFYAAAIRITMMLVTMPPPSASIKDFSRFLARWEVERGWLYA